MSLNLDTLSTDGYSLLSETTNSNIACEKLNSWITQVSKYLSANHPNTGLVAEWQSLGIVNPSSQYPLSFNWGQFKRIIDRRLTWLADLPRKVKLKALLSKPIGFQIPNPLEIPSLKKQPLSFVSLEKIKEFEELNSVDFDLLKLVTLCRELNTCHENECWYAVIALTRTILHYVPPIFGESNIESTISKFNGSSHSKALKRLIEVAKSTADINLHEQAKTGESALTEQQVNFSSELNTLLGVVYTKLKQSEKK